jgi:MFS family permease
MVLMPHIGIEKPFQWANASTWKTSILGICVAFWVSFTLLGSNLLVAEKVGKEVIPGILLFFYLFGTLITAFSGLLARAMSRKTVLFIGLALMTMGTIAINFVNSFGLFALVYILMAIGYFPVISVAGHLNYDFLGNDQKSLSRGRSCWGTLNYSAAACTAFAIPFISHGWEEVWFATSMVALAIAVAVTMLIKEEVAIKEQPFTYPDEDRLPFYQQLLSKDKSVHFSWEYVLVISGSLAVRMWPVFFMEEWIAVAMIFCGELANGLTGPFQVRLSQLLANKNKAIQRKIIQDVSNVMLILFASGLLFIMTGEWMLCITGAVMIGLAVRVFTYLKITLSPQTGRGCYTFFFITGIGQCLGCVLGLVSMTMLGIVLSLMPIVLIGIAYYNKVRLSNLISSIMAIRKAKS